MIEPNFFDLKDNEASFGVLLKDRSFGRFKEKTLIFNKVAMDEIDRICKEKNYTRAWQEEEGKPKEEDGYFTMTKIPVIILVKLMQRLPENKQEVLIGAYSIGTNPQERPCMNVIVGRQKLLNGTYNVQKFSLYYPDNSKMEGENAWPLLEGYSFRTGVLKGGLDDSRAVLEDLETNQELKDRDLVIDKEDDCAYIRHNEGDTEEEKRKRIRTVVDYMDENLKDSLLESYSGNYTTALVEEYMEFLKEIKG